MRFSLQTLLLITLIGATLITGGLWLKDTIEQNVAVAYASWGCGELLVDFMESNDGRWPKDMTELEAFYESSGETYPGLGSFSNLQRNVEIDFDFDPTADSAAWIENPIPERVVQYRQGSEIYVDGHEANSRILRYLTEKQESTADDG